MLGSFEAHSRPSPSDSGAPKLFSLLVSSFLAILHFNLCSTSCPSSLLVEINSDSFFVIGVTFSQIHVCSANKLFHIELQFSRFVSKNLYCQYSPFEASSTLNLSDALGPIACI